MTRVWFFALSLALTAAACSNPGAPDDTPTTPTRSVKAFFGTLEPLGTQFYSFTTSIGGTTDVTLQVLRPASASVPALSTPLVLSVGTPQGTGCGEPVLTRVTASPALIPQLTTSTATSTYCVSVTDTGGLTTNAEFYIRIVHP